MSFPFILPLQVRAATDAGASVPPSDASAPTPTPAADGGAPTPASSSDASAPPADASVPPADAGAPPTGDASVPTPASSQAPAPAGSQAAASSSTAVFTGVSVSAAFDWLWRGFGSSRNDTHNGAALSFSIGPRWNFGNFHLDPQLQYRHEWASTQIPAEFGMGFTSSAQIDSISLGLLMGYRLHPFFEIGGAFRFNVDILSANAPMDGQGGLRYANNALGYSVNSSVGYGPEGSLYLMIPEQRIGDSPVMLGGGVRGTLGYSSFNLTPDSIDRSPMDPPIGVGSLYGGIGVFLQGRFGDSTLSRPGSQPQQPVSQTQASQPQPTPQVQQTQAAPPPAQSQAPAPSEPRVPAAQFTVEPEQDGTYRGVSNPQDFNRFFQTQIAHSQAVNSAIGQSPAFTLRLSIRYTGSADRNAPAGTAGTVSVTSITVGDHTYQNGHFPANMVPSSAVIQSILDAIRAQLPAYTGNRTRPLTVTLEGGTAATSQGTPPAQPQQQSQQPQAH
ncbi:MAG: hypothetical protein U1F57_00905 [bacterium]